jgi:hypothetical protein
MTYEGYNPFKQAEAERRARLVAPPLPERGDPFEPFSKLPPERDPRAMASAIVLAGKKRRNEVVEDLRPPAGSLGRAILDAAAKARGEDVK